MDLACHLELSELRTSNHATNVGGCVASFAKHATAAHGQGAENSVPGVLPMANTCLISCARVGLISCANAGTCTATIAGSVHNPTVATVRYQDKPRHTQRPRTRKSVSIEQRV
jgi:hypothetical protein